MEWPLLHPRPETPGKKSQRRDASNKPLSISRPKPSHTVTEPVPYTPTKTSSLLDHDAPGALRYPYTPESSRVLRASTVGSLSPIPWDTGSRSSASPVQNALSSCIAHFENLTATRELTDDQMEYIVGQFENMTSYLAAPDAQSKKGTDDLFSGADSPRPASPNPATETTEDSSYITEVGRYIEDVQLYTTELERRFQETKALNEIQLTIIDGLRKELAAGQQNMQNPLTSNVSEPDTSRRTKIDSSWGSIETAVDDNNDQLSSSKVGLREATMIESSTQTEESKNTAMPRKPVPVARRGFWTALYEALDGFSDDLHEP